MLYSDNHCPHTIQSPHAIPSNWNHDGKMSINAIGSWDANRLRTQDIMTGRLSLQPTIVHHLVDAEISHAPSGGGAGGCGSVVKRLLRAAIHAYVFFVRAHFVRCDGGQDCVDGSDGKHSASKALASSRVLPRARLADVH